MIVTSSETIQCQCVSVLIFVSLRLTDISVYLMWNEGKWQSQHSFPEIGKEHMSSLKESIFIWLERAIIITYWF